MKDKDRLKALEEEVAMLRKEVERLRYLIRFDQPDLRPYYPMPTIPMPNTGTPFPPPPWTVTCNTP